MKEESSEGAIVAVPRFNIDLRVDALREGQYTLRLLDRKKTIATIHFKK